MVLDWTRQDFAIIKNLVNFLISQTFRSQTFSNSHNFLNSVKSTDPKTIRWKSVQFFSWLNVLRINSCIKFILIISRIFSHCLNSCLMHNSLITLVKYQRMNLSFLIRAVALHACLLPKNTIVMVALITITLGLKVFWFLGFYLYQDSVCCRNGIQKRQCAAEQYFFGCFFGLWRVEGGGVTFHVTYPQ